MSSVVERDIAHIRSRHIADLRSQRKVTSEFVDYLIDRLTPRSKSRCCAMNYATSMVMEKRMEHEGKTIALDPRTSMML